MAIIEKNKTQVAGVDVQPIINHGTPAWRIFKPGGDGAYVSQFTPAAAAITVTRWAKVPTSLPDVMMQLKRMHEDHHDDSK